MLFIFVNFMVDAIFANIHKQDVFVRLGKLHKCEELGV